MNGLWIGKGQGPGPIIPDSRVSIRVPGRQELVELIRSKKSSEYMLVLNSKV